jgi:hypothetical protein
VTVPARISCIVARKAPVVAVFRRGPSKQVALLEWNLLTNRVELGQWLKGRIYDRRADLSPDGRYLIYFAGNHQWQTDPLHGTWTAVSQVPYLRALHIYGWGHAWNGGGLFIDNKTYWLNDARMGYRSVGNVECGLEVSKRPPDGVTPNMGEDPVTYIPRLMRDGWVLVSQGSDGPDVWAFRFERRIRAGWILEKTFRSGSYAGPFNEPYHDVHKLIGPA